MRRSGGILLVVLSLLAPAGASAQVSVPLDRVAGCDFNLLSNDFAVPATAPATIGVRVAVVLNEVAVGEARRIVARAEQAYTPLGIDLQPTFLRARIPTQDPELAYDEMRRLFGGQRPAWAHAVMLVTATDIASGPQGSSVAGQVGCVGGAAYPDRAFGVSEAGQGLRQGAEVFAHELGHLLSAHHHYANCAQGDRTSGAFDACTVMFNDVTLTSLTFGPAEAATIRGAAEMHVKPPTVAPPADGTAITELPPPADLCAKPVYDDPPGDQSTSPGLEAGEGDVLDGRFVSSGGRPALRFRVAEADGTFDRANGVFWELRWASEHNHYTLIVRWDGQSPPTASLADAETGSLTSLTGTTVTKGTPGVVEVPWPGTLDDTLRLGDLRGVVGPLLPPPAELIFNSDRAAPLTPFGRLGDCALFA